MSVHKVSGRDQEAIDIAFVRARTGLVYVLDPDALGAFTEGDGVFDVDPHGRKLDAFLEKHKLQYRLDTEDLLLPLDPASEPRPVDYASARWKKRSRGRPVTAA